MKLYKIVPAVFAATLVLALTNTVTAATLTVGNASSLPCTGTFPTIQSAVTAASAGDTISVCQGTYPELVTIDKTLTFLGAQNGVDARTRSVPAANESVVGSGDGAFQIEADNVVIDGFTIQGVVNDPSAPPFTGLGAGIWSNPGFSGTQGGHQIFNNIIQNNIAGIELDSTCLNPTLVKFNLIQNNNASGAGSGNGIETNFGLCNATVDSNKLVGNASAGASNFGGGSGIVFSNNEFASNDRAFSLFNVTGSSITTNNIHNSTDAATADIRIFGGVSGLTISCNDLANGPGSGIRINDAGFGGGPNSSITINTNNISGYPIAGLQVDSAGYTGGPGSLDATNDWWGNSTGPTIASNSGGTGEPIVDPDGVVKYKPFLASPSSCATCPNSNPGCTTNQKDCHDFAEQEEKNFNDMQKAQKKAFDSQPHTPAQKKAFENQQKSDKAAFEQHYKAEEAQCKQLPNK